MTDTATHTDFFNQPLSAIFRPNITTCPADSLVQAAAEKMSRYHASAILVTGDDRKIIGIVTDADLREKIVANNMPGSTPVSDIMSSPVTAISTDGQVFDAFLTMMQADKRHLAVTGRSGEICGILTEKDLITAQTESSALLIKSVTSAQAMSDLDNIHADLCRMLLTPIKNGVAPEVITRLITAFSDAILHKIMGFSLAETGPPPCPFAFLIMGSEGREEQTLISDQDNAIVYADPANDTEADRFHTYFQDLAARVCTRLDQAGFRFCDGNNMAQNPRWCRPLSTWKQYFHGWIHNASPEDLLHASIFFDFKGAYGDLTLADALKTYLLTHIRGWSGFLRHMTENTLHFRPPIGLFGKLRVESQGTHKNAFDIKYAMLPIVDVTRVYALKNGIAQTNTLARLFRLYTRHAMTSKEYHDIVQCYNFLMTLRFRRQITTIMDEGAPPDNYVTPDNLTHLDRHMLREIFKTVEKFQQKLNIEFTGIA